MSKQYRAVFAEENTLQQYNCIKVRNDVVSADAPDSLTIHGWTFSSFHSVIPNDEENHALLRSIKEKLFNNFDSIRREIGSGGLQEYFADEHLTVNNYKLKMIPMIFSNDVMRISHGADEDKNSIELRSEDALFCWIAQHTAENVEKYPLNVLQVPYAGSWNARHLLNISEESKTTAEALEFAKSGNPCDWTLSSDYCCSLTNNRDGSSRRDGAVLSARRLSELVTGSGSNAFSGRVQPSTTSGIDFDMLRDRNAPILFYDECILYQDDLDDSGEVVFEVKLRVMPLCWFLVSKFYLRVDGVRTRCRETRLFHKFSESSSSNSGGAASVVHMELTWREGPHLMEPQQQQLQGSGGPSGKPQTRATTSSSSSSSNLDLRNNTHTIPLLEGEVHRYFTLSL